MVSHSHTFDNTTLQDQATAHFGDSYTNYHIYTAADRSTSSRQDLLSVNTSVLGIFIASTQIIELISRASDAPRNFKDIQVELLNLKLIMSGLQPFLNRTNTVVAARTSLVPIQDVIAVITQLVLVFSELDGVVQRCTSNNFILLTRRSNIAAAGRLLDQLQRHKLSLSLILRIIQWYVSSSFDYC